MDKYIEQFEALLDKPKGKIKKVLRHIKKHKKLYTIVAVAGLITYWLFKEEDD